LPLFFFYLNVFLEIIDGDLIYDGTNDRMVVEELLPAHTYAFRTRACAEGDDGVISDPTIITTEESGT
jgi:hypothetical protein